MNAKEYRKLVSEKQTEIPLFDVTLPSGAVWKLKEPPIQQFVLAGKIPASFAAKMARIAGKSGGNMAAAKETALKDLSADDLLDSLAFGRDLLLYCAVSPKISLDPKTEDEIAPEEIHPEDFTFLINWVMKGGNSGDSLSNFRSKRRKPAVGGSRRA